MNPSPGHGVLGAYFIIDDYAKDGGKELFTKMHAFELRILNDSIGIRLKNAVHLGKKFLAAIFSVMVYCGCPNRLEFDLTKTGCFIGHWKEN